MPYKDSKDAKTRARLYKSRLGEFYRAKRRTVDAKKYGKKGPNGSWVANMDSPFRHGIWNRNDGFYIR